VAFTVILDETKNQYQLLDEQTQIGVADFHLENQEMVLDHTLVDPKYSGQGLGEKLIFFVLDDLLAKKYKVVPRCWFVAKVIKKYPEKYLDLVSLENRKLFGL
jgi:predicted GNAT family acetyltransferase